MKILLNLVSGQPLPNYLADKIISPDKNLLLYSEDSVKETEQLKKVLGSKVETIKISAFDYEGNYQLTQSLINKYATDEVFVHITSGTKIDSMALLNAALAADREAMYINTQGDNYLLLRAVKGIVKTTQNHFSVKGSLRDLIHLAGHESRVRTMEETDAQAQLRNFLENNFFTYVYMISDFIHKNPKSFNNEIHPTKKEIAGSSLSYSDGKSIVRFVKKGKELLNLVDDGTSLLEYLTKGTWFEYACFLQLQKSGLFDETLMNVTIRKKEVGTRDRFDDKNEMDILAIKGIYPTVFECKSGNVKAEAVEKLIANKSNYLPRYTDAYLVTYFPLDGENNESHRLILEKLTDARIRHIRFSELKNFRKIQNHSRANLK